MYLKLGSSAIDTSQVLSSHTWLVATILGSSAVEGPWQPQCQKLGFLENLGLWEGARLSPHHALAWHLLFLLSLVKTRPPKVRLITPKNGREREDVAPSFHLLSLSV